MRAKENNNEPYTLTFPYPISRFGIEINQKCNLHCSYCWNQKWNTREIDLQTTYQTLSILYESFKTWPQGTNLPHINFYAAEPLLSPNILFTLLNDFPFYFSIITNGTLLQGEIKEKLLYYNPSLLISLDGIESNHNYYRNNSFDKVITNILQYDRYNKLNLAMTVNLKSLDCLYESLAYMFSLPVAKFECHLNLYDDWTDEDFNNYITILIQFINDFIAKETLPQFSIIERFANLSNAQNYQKDRGGPLHQLDINGEILIEKPFRSCLLLSDKKDLFYGKVFAKNNVFLSQDLQKRYFDFMQQGFTNFNYYSDYCDKCYFKNKCKINRINEVYLRRKECYPILETFILEELFWNKEACRSQPLLTSLMNVI